MKKSAFDQAKADKVVVEHPAFELSEADIKTNVVEIVKAAKELVNLSEAGVIVSVGRGISSDVEKGLALAKELADELGGVVGASRAAVDSGWLSSGWPDWPDCPSAAVCCAWHFWCNPAQGWHG